MLAIIITWIIFCGVVGYIAKERGRDPVIWTLVSAVISPLLGIIVLLAIGDK